MDYPKIHTGNFAGESRENGFIIREILQRPPFPVHVRLEEDCVAKHSLRLRLNRDSVDQDCDSRERSMMGRRERGQRLSGHVASMLRPAAGT